MGESAPGLRLLDGGDTVYELNTQTDQLTRGLPAAGDWEAQPVCRLPPGEEEKPPLEMLEGVISGPWLYLQGLREGRQKL